MIMELSEEPKEAAGCRDWNLGSRPRLGVSPWRKLTASAQLWVLPSWLGAQCPARMALAQGHTVREEERTGP